MSPLIYISECASYLWLRNEVYLYSCWLARFCTWLTYPHSCIGKFLFISGAS
jgi:hypothetical protein